MSVETDNSVAECLEAIEILDGKDRKPQVAYFYKLGDEIANGVRYFGQEQVNKGLRTAMCIYPKCGELWRVRLHMVRIGSSQSCGCRD